MNMCNLYEPSALSSREQRLTHTSCFEESKQLYWLACRSRWRHRRWFAVQRLHCLTLWNCFHPDLDSGTCPLGSYAAGISALLFILRVTILSVSSVTDRSSPGTPLYVYVCNMFSCGCGRYIWTFECWGNGPRKGLKPTCHWNVMFPLIPIHGCSPRFMFRHFLYNKRAVSRTLISARIQGRKLLAQSLLAGRRKAHRSACPWSVLGFDLGVWIDAIHWCHSLTGSRTWCCLCSMLV